MIFGKVYQHGDVIGKLVNTTNNTAEILLRIARINGYNVVVKDTIADATTVKPLVGREYATLAKNGIAGYTTVWESNFHPVDDLAKLATSADAGLAYGITLGQSTQNGTTITADNYTVLRSSVISSEYIETQALTTSNLANSPELLAMVVIANAYKEILLENGLLLAAQAKIKKVIN